VRFHGRREVDPVQTHIILTLVLDWLPILFG